MIFLADATQEQAGTGQHMVGSVYMRNSRGLKVPPLSPGGFMAQQDICGPQAHKMGGER